MNERQEAWRRGRRARVARQVHKAVTALIGERGYGNFTVGEVAARAGVADSSIYRRWGNLAALLSDVARTRLNPRSPMPDSGDLSAPPLRRKTEHFVTFVGTTAALICSRRLTTSTTVRQRAMVYGDIACRSPAG